MTGRPDGAPARDPLDRWEAAAKATYLHGDPLHVEPEDVLALVAVARAAQELTRLPFGSLDQRDFYRLRESLARLDGAR